MLLKAAASRAEITKEDLYGKISSEIYQGLFQFQCNFLDDDNLSKAALCSRRSGKTFACRSDLLITALTIPNSYSIYVNKSRQECRRIMWNGKDGLKNFCHKYGLVVAKNEKSKRRQNERRIPPAGQVKINETYLEMTFANGSIIQLIGADDSAEIEKLRGSAYDKVVVDEAQDFGQLQYFTEEIIGPALMDNNGTISLIGTPSPSCAGYFYEITCEKPQEDYSGWSVHSWTYRDNTAVPNLLEAVEKEKRKKKWDDNHPAFLRSYCAKWVKSDDEFVYEFHAAAKDGACFWSDEKDSALPVWIDNTGKPRDHQWEYFMGVDIGWKDPFAFTIWASTPTLEERFEVISYKAPKLNADEQFEILQELCEQYEFTKIVVDSTATGKSTVEAWKARGLPLEDAIKTEKHAAIHTANAWLQQGRLKFYRGSPLAGEMENLRWVTKSLGSPRPKEDKNSGQGNDCCDAFVYIFKEWMADYEVEAIEEKPRPGSKEALELEMLAYEEKMDEEWRAKQSGHFFTNYYQQANSRMSDERN